MLMRFFPPHHSDDTLRNTRDARLPPAGSIAIQEVHRNGQEVVAKLLRHGEAMVSLTDDNATVLADYEEGRRIVEPSVRAERPFQCAPIAARQSAALSCPIVVAIRVKLDERVVGLRDLVARSRSG